MMLRIIEATVMASYLSVSGGWGRHRLSSPKPPIYTYTAVIFVCRSSRCFFVLPRRHLVDIAVVTSLSPSSLSSSSMPSSSSRHYLGHILIAIVVVFHLVILVSLSSHLIAVVRRYCHSSYSFESFEML